MRLNLKVKLLVSLTVSVVAVALLFFLKARPVPCYLIGLVIGIATHFFLTCGYNYVVKVEKTVTEENPGEAERVKVTVSEGGDKQ